jgi:hypothetical protein
MTAHARAPRELLLHPVALAAIAVLVANDHWLKLRHPGWLTGKLSDVAGLVFFPLLLVIVVDGAAARCNRRLPRTLATVAIAAAVTAAGFALVKLAPWATEVYRQGLGALQWPAQLAWAVAHGARIPGIVAVAAVTDPSDLIALPFAAVAVWIARRTGFASPDLAAE